MRHSLLPALAAAAAVGAAACGSSSSSGGADTAAYCSNARAVHDFEGQLNALGPNTTIAQLKSLFASLTPKVHAADASAPAAIASSWHTVTGLWDTANNAIQGASDLAGAASAVQNLNSSAADAAGKQIDTYTRTTCGFTIGSPSPSA